jgi:hypothetical protein
VHRLAFYAQHTQSDGLLHAWDTSQWDFLGDWITPHGSESVPTADVNILFNNCYLLYITMLAAKIAAVLGHAADATQYTAAAQKLAASINAAYYKPSSGAYIDVLQTHLVMPLAGGAVPKERQDATMGLLATAIETAGGHLDTGLTANYFMTKLLTEAGRNDLMCTLAATRHTAHTSRALPYPLHSACNPYSSMRCRLTPRGQTYAGGVGQHVLFLQVPGCMANQTTHPSCWQGALLTKQLSQASETSGIQTREPETKPRKVEHRQAAAQLCTLWLIWVPIPLATAGTSWHRATLAGLRTGKSDSVAMTQFPRWCGAIQPYSFVCVATHH